jgi:hypothetical protein
MANGKSSGFLWVGVNDNQEVVINHPDIQPDKDGAGYIVFSPAQARNLAALLVKQAKIAESGS